MIRFGISTRYGYIFHAKKSSTIDFDAHWSTPHEEVSLRARSFSIASVLVCPSCPSAGRFGENSLMTDPPLVSNLRVFRLTLNNFQGVFEWVAAFWAFITVTKVRIMNTKPWVLTFGSFHWFRFWLRFVFLDSFNKSEIIRILISLDDFKSNFGCLAIYPVTLPNFEAD